MKQTFFVVPIAIAVAHLFSFAHVPLAWMLGPLATGLYWLYYREQDFYWSIKWRDWSLLPIGYGMGRYVTADTLTQMVVQLPGMIAATGLMLVVCFVLARVTASRAGVSYSSSILGSTPGGLSQMTVLSEEFDHTNLAAVTFMQTARLLGVVCIVPFLAMHGFSNHIPPTAAQAASVTTSLTPGGWLTVVLAVAIGGWLAVRLRWPTPYMLGPVFTVAAVSLLAGPLPPLSGVLLNGPQLIMGLYLAKKFQVQELDHWRELAFYTAISVLIMIVTSIALAWGLSAFYGFSIATAFLAMAPGGIAEMGMTGMALGEEVSIIFAYQLFRLLFVLGVLPIFLRKLLIKSSADL